MHQKLVAAGIDATLILDSAVAYVIEQYITMVMVGAEVVAQSGGIINKVKLIYDFLFLIFNTSDISQC